MKIILFAASLVLAFSANRAAGQTTQGYDVLGLAMYCEEFLSAPRMEAVSTLLDTFGDPLPCIEKRIAQGGIKKVQIDLRDATCWRNRVCPPGTPSLTDWKVMRVKAAEVNRLAVKYPSIEWWVSPWLEHDIKDAATVVEGCKVVTDTCRTCWCINSPVSGARPPRIPLELHGTTSKAFSVSGDGASLFDGDNVSSDKNGFEHRIAGTDQTYAWFNELNLRCTGEKSFTPPLKRTEKPSADLFRQAFLVMQPEQPVPPAPSLCKAVRRVDARKGEILKTNAESYCNGAKKDSRGNKPLLIITKKGRVGDRLPVYDKGGKQVGCFAYFGPFTTRDTFRWYMGNCSGETPSKLYDELQGEWGYVDLGEGSCLLLNAVRRMGIYR